MPPKFKFSKQEMIDAAFKLVRNDGWQNLSTRTLAKVLGSSARPIYSFFKSIDELEEELVSLSVDLLYTYMTRKWSGDPWIDHGIGYVMFAQEEKHLFRGCNNEKNIHLFKIHGDVIWKKCTDSLCKYAPFKDLSLDQIFELQYTRWLMTHGLAFQVSNPPPDIWTDEKIALVVQKGSKAILDGFKCQSAH